jgi:hypothetical protein
LPTNYLQSIESPQTFRHIAPMHGVEIAAAARVIAILAISLACIAPPSRAEGPSL